MLLNHSMSLVYSPGNAYYQLVYGCMCSLNAHTIPYLISWYPLSILSKYTTHHLVLVMLTDKQADAFYEWLSLCPLEYVLLYEDFDGIAYRFVIPTEPVNFAESFFDD